MKYKRKQSEVDSLNEKRVKQAVWHYSLKDGVLDTKKLNWVTIRERYFVTKIEFEAILITLKNKGEIEQVV